MIYVLSVFNFSFTDFDRRGTLKLELRTQSLINREKKLNVMSRGTLLRKLQETGVQ